MPQAHVCLVVNFRGLLVVFLFLLAAEQRRRYVRALCVLYKRLFFYLFISVLAGAGRQAGWRQYVSVFSCLATGAVVGDIVVDVVAVICWCCRTRVIVSIEALPLLL